MEIALVLLITAGAVWLFVTEKFRSDLVALMVLGALVLTGLFLRFMGWGDPAKWITPEEGISGFSNPATITVAAMFVLSAGLQKTGGVAYAARLLRRLIHWPWCFLLLMMLAVGLVSAFINNTAAVAVFLPLVLAASAGGNVSASKLLIPLSFASQFGGVCTLIGTSTNLLVSSLSDRAGHGAFSMFEFTPMGVILLGAGTVYLLGVSRWLLPDRRGAELVTQFQMGSYLAELRVLPDSRLVGKTIPASGFGRREDVTVLEILRRGMRLFAPLHEPVQAGDVLLVRCGAAQLLEVKAAWKLELDPEFKLRDERVADHDLQLAEVLVAANSRFIGRTLAELDFRRRYEAVVLAVQARTGTVREQLNRVRLQFGDALLLLGPKDALARLRSDPNVILLEQVEEPSLRRSKVPLAAGIIAAVVALAAFNVMPILVSAIVGGIALVVTRCLTLEEAYAAIDWKVIFLLAGVLPLGLAMERSGAAKWLADLTLGPAGALGPVFVLAVLYLLTAVLTEFMSNNGTAVLMTPVAISTAATLGVDPRPLLMAVCFAASTSFATPVGYQTNAMVHHPGGYRYTDFMRVGIPLNLIFCALSVYFIPRFWPF